MITLISAADIGLSCRAQSPPSSQAPRPCRAVKLLQISEYGCTIRLFEKCIETGVECKVKCCSSDFCNDVFRPKGIFPIPDTPQSTPCSGSSLSSPCNFLISISLSVFVFLKLQLKT